MKVTKFNRLSKLIAKKTPGYVLGEHGTVVVGVGGRRSIEPASRRKGNTRRIRGWRVENSWGEKESGKSGFYTMNDSWFDEYMFEVAIEKKYLPAELLEAWQQEPISLSVSYF